jgi:hypothetical protein
MRLFFAALAAIVLLAAAPPGQHFDGGQRARILAGISQALHDYIFPDVADRVRSGLQNDKARLLAISAPEEFAHAVSDDLRALGNDKHLDLMYSPDTLAPEQNPSAAEVAHDNQAMVLMNEGVRDAQWLPGNIGYIRISAFPPRNAQTDRAIDAAMAVVANTDALIIDLRRNGGGDSSSLDYWMGYLFAKPVQLTAIRWMTPKPHVDRQFSAARVGGARYLKPVYVLTGSQTISCAEQFTYDLKALHRATIVGQTTAGGANPGAFRRLTDHFAVFIPTGEAYNPYTKTNWEHTGITPDALVDEKAALVTAYAAALRNDTNGFDVLAAQRKRLLQDPQTVLNRVFAL